MEASYPPVLIDPHCLVALNFLYSVGLFLDLTIGIIACIEAVLAISPVVTFRKELAILIVVLHWARHHPELIGLVKHLSPF
jgi:hypothetical protein